MPPRRRRSEAEQQQQHRPVTRSQSSSSPVVTRSAAPVPAHRRGSYDGSDVYSEDEASGQPRQPRRQTQASTRATHQRWTRRSRAHNSGGGSSSSENDAPNQDGRGEVDSGDEEEDRDDDDEDEDEDDQDSGGDHSEDHSALSNLSSRIDEADSLEDASPEEVERHAMALIRPFLKDELGSKEYTAEEVPRRMFSLALAMRSTTPAEQGEGEEALPPSVVDHNLEKIKELNEDALKFLRQCVAKLDETDWQYSTPKVFEATSTRAAPGRRSTTVLGFNGDEEDGDAELGRIQASWLDDDATPANLQALARELQSQSILHRTASVNNTQVIALDDINDVDSDTNTAIEMEDQSGISRNLDDSFMAF
ncbi:hypothetical protein OIO90_000540 [Microbotryomycetes sp. JL221]|nr:hypothetical protein OIO90_000540 [Microbotryomycetes sp. JL221]